jgi:hypothetical protein
MTFNLEPDTPWHEVVINSISVGHTPNGTVVDIALNELYEWNPWLSSALKNLKGARFLLSSHTEETQPAIALTQASLKLSFSDAAVASQLLQEGHVQ